MTRTYSKQYLSCGRKAKRNPTVMAGVLHVASLHQVSAEDICKAIANEGIDSKSSEYVPLFSATCKKVAEGMDVVFHSPPYRGALLFSSNLD